MRKPVGTHVWVAPSGTHYTQSKEHSVIYPFSCNLMESVHWVPRGWRGNEQRGSSWWDEHHNQGLFNMSVLNRVFRGTFKTDLIALIRQLADVLPPINVLQARFSDSCIKRQDSLEPHLCRLEISLSHSQCENVFCSHDFIINNWT